MGATATAMGQQRRRWSIDVLQWGICNGTGAGATGATAIAMGQEQQEHWGNGVPIVIAIDRSCGCMWGRGARAWAFYSVFFIPKRFVNAQMEVRLKEWRTCLTTLTTVYSGWFGLSLVNALTQLRNCMFICNDEPCLEANLQVIPAGYCDDGYIDCIQ
jgi:hypothetical protein